MKIENINCKTLISNIIETSSIDTCNFCLETIMFCTTNQRLNIKSKCCGRHFVTPKFANFQAQQHRDKIPRAVKIYNRNKNKNIYRLPTLLSSLWCLYFVLYHQLQPFSKASNMMVNTLQHQLSGTVQCLRQIRFRNPLAVSNAPISNHDSIILIAK